MKTVILRTLGALFAFVLTAASVSGELKILSISHAEFTCSGSTRCIHLYELPQSWYEWTPYGTSLTCRNDKDPLPLTTWVGQCQAGAKGYTGMVIRCHGTESGFVIEYESLTSGKTTLTTYGEGVGAFSAKEPTVNDLKSHADKPLEADDVNVDVWIKCPIRGVND